MSVRFTTPLFNFAGLIALCITALSIGPAARAEVAAVYGSVGEFSNDDAYILRAIDPDPVVEDPLVSLTQPSLGIDIDVGGGKLYYIDQDANEIRRSNLDGSSVETIGSGFSDLRAIGLDLVNGKLYWGDIGSFLIQRSNLDGSSVETVVDQSVGATEDIAIDAAGGKVYWINGGILLRADLDGSNIQGVAGGDPTNVVPGSIALDVPNGKVYWTHENEGVRRANLDGTSAETLVLSFDEGGPNIMSIALDLVAGEMYWTNFLGGVIRKANLDGTGIRTVYSPENGATFFALDATNRMMYWTENLSLGNDILRAELPPIDVVTPDLITAAGLAVHNNQLYYVDTDRTGVTTGVGSIHRANLDGSGDQTLLSSLTFPYSIAIDPVGGKFYWTDIVEGIRRANLNGTNSELIVTTTTPIHVEIDPVNSKIYWTESGSNSIRRANLDGSSVETVLPGLAGPRGLAIHSGLGKIYWTQPGGTEGIFRSNLNGTNIETIVPDASLKDPFSLRLDVLSGKMYWTEQEGGPLRRANVDGSNVEIVYGSNFPAIEIALLTQPSAEVWVDFAASGFEAGTQANPFNSLQEGLAAVSSGGSIFFAGDSTDTTSNETLTINQPVTLEAVGGSVTIGSAGGRNPSAKVGFVAPAND